VIISFANLSIYGDYYLFMEDGTYIEHHILLIFSFLKTYYLLFNNFILHFILVLVDKHFLRMDIYLILIQWLQQ